eukprot:COSAG01_NODE_3646_length_5830_cov_7.276217_4_plen_50_part_00
MVPSKGGEVALTLDTSRAGRPASHKLHMKIDDTPTGGAVGRCQDGCRAG